MDPRPQTRWRQFVERVVGLPPERVGRDPEVDDARADAMANPLSETPHADSVLAAIRPELLPMVPGLASDRPDAIQDALVDVIETNVLEERDRVDPEPIPSVSLVTDVLQTVEHFLPVADDHLLYAAPDDRVGVVDRRSQ